MMAASTRPLTLGEILDRTVELYRRNFLLFAGISTLPSAVMVLAVGGVAVLLSSQFASLKPTGDEGAIMIGVVVVLGLILGLPILIAAFSLSLGASNFAVLKTHRGEKATIRESYGYAFRHFWRHVGILMMQILLAWIVPYMVFTAMIVIGSIVGALLVKSGAGTAGQSLLVFLFVVLIVALLVACILVWVRFSLAFAVTVAEDKKVWPSMQRSGQLTKGSRWRILVMFLMIGFLSFTISAALMIPIFIVLAVVFQKSLSSPSPPTIFFILLETANLSVSFLVRAFVTPIYSVALLLFYYDQKTRQEGYDIELLMESAGWSEIPPPPPPPGFVPVPASPGPVFAPVQLPTIPAVLAPPPPVAPVAPPPPSEVSEDHESAARTAEPEEHTIDPALAASSSGLISTPVSSPIGTPKEGEAV